MPWARASALDRHMECPAASHLPILDRGVWQLGYLQPGVLVAPPGPVDEEDSSAADWGTAMHAAKAHAPEAAEPWVTLVEPHIEVLWPSHLGEHEVSVAYDCRTRKLTTFRHPSEQARTDWKMAQSPDCVVGTCDWWGRLPSGEPWVDDLKTGWKKPDPVGPQNLFYLLCRLLDEDAKDWQTGRASITWWPRAAAKVDEDGNVVAGTEPSREGLWRQLARNTLEAFQEELHWAWVRAHGLNPAPRPGPHCGYCPSRLVCDRAND